MINDFDPVARTVVSIGARASNRKSPSEECRGAWPTVADDSHCTSIEDDAWCIVPDAWVLGPRCMS